MPLVAVEPPKEPAGALTPERRRPVARVAAIGASAGGLEAFLDLVSALPASTGLAYVVIQHLDPHHASMLSRILGGATPMSVQEVTDGMRIEMDHVYVIAPDTELTIEHDTLRLVPRTPHVPHRPLDRFFRSLAADRESDAIGIVLSGNDADGAAGLQAIHDAGGLTFVQSPESAKFDVMPRAAAAGADYVLTPAGIAEQLGAILAREASPGQEMREPPVRADFDRVLDLLHGVHRVDFHHFKRASIERRILRRVRLGNHRGLHRYADSLETDPAALDTLFRDLLIGVTSFFRDPDRFAALENVVFPALAAGGNRNGSIRVWAAGCSTGEEVYSLAMAILESLDGLPDPPRLTIYGTDINEQALKKARTAVYPEDAVTGLSAERLRRFFTVVPGGYKIAKALRELCVFAAHDLTRDPPYSRIDLLLCCNVLIYFDAELQRKAVAMLQYALAPGGFLMLGSSENLRGTPNQLTAVSSKPLIYRKPAGVATSPLPPVSVVKTAPHAPRAAAVAHDEDDALLAAHFAPCAVLIDEQAEMLRIRGDLSPFLVTDSIGASSHLFRLVRFPEVVAELRPAVRAALRDGVAVRSGEILVAEGEVRQRVAFEVIPLETPMQEHRCWILFRRSAAGASRAGSASRRNEVATLRHALAAAVDDREQLADEAAAAAEEAQSSDEELRSTNEELETAKEELQSANDELSALNDELQVRNATLVRMNDDIENLLGAIEIPILFAGADMSIRRFNATAGRTLNLRSDATGMPLREANGGILEEAHIDAIASVIAGEEPVDLEMQNAGGGWHLLRIRPYRTSEGVIDGAIVALLDIDQLKRSVLAAEEAARAATMLSQASALLASSLDYETTLESLTRLSTAAFADWCAVDLINDDGTIRHLTVSHANSVLRELALEFQQAAFREPERAPGAPQALRLRKSILLNDLAAWEQSGIAPVAKITQLIDALGVRSLISVPLIVRDKVLGTTTFASSRRSYGPADLYLAEELSQRAATAIDTAMLFREAESANRYKDAFLGTVAHELRTPLTSIIGWVQLARGNPGIASEALANVDQSASLLRAFVEDLLDVTRIREQKLSIQMTDVDLASIVRASLEITASAASARRVEIGLHLSFDPAPVSGDGVRLLQVMWNLLSNAIKFTPPGGRIDVRLEREGPDARLSVIDNGIGISAEFVPHVFELYRQADASAGHMPGLGIGLAIVSQIVSLHAGRVRAESGGIGRGSAFIVTIPVRIPAPSERRASRRSNRPRRSGSKKAS
jgi:two-component system CheB/CheR fusion protein